MKHTKHDIQYYSVLGYINELMGFKNNIYMRIAQELENGNLNKAEELFLTTDLNI